jgi:predicted heme/steroid binding protein
MRISLFTFLAFTLEELAQYDGITNPKVYLAVKDVVFDVSISRKFRFLGVESVIS